MTVARLVLIAAILLLSSLPSRAVAAASEWADSAEASVRLVSAVDAVGV